MKFEITNQDQDLFEQGNVRLTVEAPLSKAMEILQDATTPRVDPMLVALKRQLGI